MEATTTIVRTLTVTDHCCDYSEEAIPERDPSYQLPDIYESDITTEGMSKVDALLWNELLKRRPSLIGVHGRFPDTPLDK